MTPMLRETSTEDVYAKLGTRPMPERVNAWKYLAKMRRQ
jgi:hypothetical protein